MLRGLSAPQWEELRTFEELHPSGEDRMDERFAVLAEIVAAGGFVKLQGKTKDDPTLSRADYLKILRGDEEKRLPEEPTQPQTLEQQMLFIDSWISGSNAAFRQQKKRLKKADKRFAQRQKQREAKERLENERPS